MLSMPRQKKGTSQVEVEGCPNHADVIHQKVSLSIKKKFYCSLCLVSPKLARLCYVNPVVFEVRGQFD